MTKDKEQESQKQTKEEIKLSEKEIKNIPKKKGQKKPLDNKDIKLSKEKTEKLPDNRDQVKPGMIVAVHEKVVDTTPKGENRERIQVFKGIVLARKHGQEKGASLTVRKESDGVGVEKIFPIYSPLIERIVIQKKFKTRRAKLYFLRDSKKRLKEIKG